MFPPVEDADELGLLCWGGNLLPSTLLNAYSNGIFPWPHRGYPLLWFAPPQRALLFFDELHIGKRLGRYLRRANYEIRFDSAFEEVIEVCSGSRVVEGEIESGTWITAPMKRGYKQLHQLGYARSVEAFQNGTLVGGLYGVQIGHYFAGESMFHRADNASKACVLGLIERLQTEGATWLDCETLTPHFAALGAREIPRDEFMRLLKSELPASEQLNQTPE